MFGNFEGSPEQKLGQVVELFGRIAPQAYCRLSEERDTIICEAVRGDGRPWIEELPIELLPAEIVRHAAMRLGKATHPSETIGNWERWACAWHLIQTRGDRAIDFAGERRAAMIAEDDSSGIAVWTDIKSRIALLQADPDSWPGQA